MKSTQSFSSSNTSTETSMGPSDIEYEADSECELPPNYQNIKKWIDGVFSAYRSYGKPTLLNQKDIQTYYKM